jgi:hypothetical protein
MPFEAFILDRRYELEHCQSENLRSIRQKCQFPIGRDTIGVDPIAIRWFWLDDRNPDLTHFWRWGSIADDSPGIGQMVADGESLQRSS